ncbi:MAG: hypothetical protein QNJ31_01630 [Candidatus Caenarcaniphilales bacterium]|nr:hypothetical protein [Candidatus Caenarcaniphilales bacterium]
MKTKNKNLSVYLFLITVSFLFSAQSFAQKIEPKEVLITVSNVPVGKPSLFIPIALSSDKLDLYRIVLKDVIFKGYIASIEKDDQDKVIGISFADFNSKSLPETLTAIIKLRLKKNSSNLSNKNKELEPKKAAEEIHSTDKSILVKKNNATRLPKTISIAWESPWAFTKPTKRIPEAYAGFNSLTLASQDIDDIEALNKEKLLRKKETKSRDFYVKSFGQTLARSKRSSSNEGNSNSYRQPIVKEVSLFALTPKSTPVEKLYVPLMLENNEDSIKISNIGQNWKKEIITRVLPNNILEISTSDPSSSLPAGSIIQGSVKIEQELDSLVENIKIGPVLSEPSESISGISVNIEPSSISVGSNPLNPLDLFKIE